MSYCPHWRALQHAAIAGPRHGSCQALITLTRRPLSSACHARFMCSAPAFYAWRRLPLICWKLLMVDLCVCTRRACCLTVSVHRTSAASVELFPRGWRAVAFPRWLHVRSCSTWLIVILMVRCCFGGLCVRDRLAACLRMSHFCCFR